MASNSNSISLQFTTLITEAEHDLGSGADAAAQSTVDAGKSMFDLLMGTPAQAKAPDANSSDAEPAATPKQQTETLATTNAIGQSVGKTVGAAAQKMQGAALTNQLKSASNGEDAAKILTNASKDGDINQVLSNLSPQQLNTVAQQLNSSGLSQDQLNSLCHDMVSGGASGQNLAKLTQAFSNNPPKVPISVGGPLIGAYSPPKDPPNLTKTLETVIAKNASIPTRLDYIKTLKPDVETQPAAAGAVGTMLASFKGNARAVNQGFGMFFPEKASASKTTDAKNGANEFAAVLKAGSISPGEGSTDIGGFTNIVNTARTDGTNPAIQAGVFQQGITTFTQMYPDWQNGSGLNPGLPDGPGIPDPEESQNLRALTNLLETNPDGIVTNLHAADETAPQQKGQALSTYASAMMGRGDSAPLSQVLDKLKFGNDLQHPNPTYANTSNNALILGYYVGSLQTAIANNNSAQQYSILGIAANLLPNPVGVASVSAWASFAQAQANNRTQSAEQALYNTATFQLPDKVLPDFNAGLSQVIPPTTS